MEKNTPHCKLEVIKLLMKEGKVRATNTALEGAAALDLSFQGIFEIVMSMTKKDFYKSMTSHNNHREWQDVYRPRTSVGDVYLKLTIRDGVLIVSFKEL